MSSKWWCAYFNETDPKKYRFLGFYEYRSKQVDFTFSFQKESYKLQMDLNNLMKDGSEESKEIAIISRGSSYSYGGQWNAVYLTVGMSAIGKWNPYNYGGQWNAVYLTVGMDHRNTFRDVNAFWNKIELNEQLQDQLQAAEVEATSSLISISTKTLTTTIGNIHSAIKNVNDTLTITGAENTKKRPAEEPSPVIIPPPNLRNTTPPPCYNSKDNFFNDYNEESTEVEDASTEASPDEIEILFQTPPDVAKDVKTKTRKHRSMEDAGSKISAKDAKRNKSSNKKIVVDAAQSTSDEFENIDKLTENIVNIEKKSPYVEVNRNDQTSLIYMLHIFQNDDDDTDDDDVKFIVSSSLSNKSKKQKMILSWEHVIEKITIDRNSDHDWIVNGYNISENFCKFQTQAVELLKSNPSFSYATDVDQILLFFQYLTFAYNCRCLSSIMYVKEDKPEYIQCSNQIWKNALPRQLIPITLPVVVQLIIVEYSTVMTFLGIENILLADKHLLINKWHQNWAKWDPTMTDEEKKIFDCVQLVMRNFFLTLTSNDIDHKMDEDTFAHRYLHLLLEEVFNTDDYKFVWANGDKGNKKHEITYGEIKPPSTPNNVVNKALIKLAEFMKGSLDDIGNKTGFETFGILIDGSNVKLFSMDLKFNGVYRLNQIGKMTLPTEHANFLTIIPVISNFYSLLKRVNHAIEKLNAPSTPINRSYHRLSNSSPQKVISILKLPPPAALI
ncbi:hypothetical protein G9A89_009031 [Geosiphon pyriformis]|nr:hypothetical protein G9A89_009031 [Geosiphon pyriformis]